MPVKERKYYFIIIVFVVFIITINQFLIDWTTILVNVIASNPLPITIRNR